jgi:uncharacterized SAM-binding protein YcdF (DUF218 family)
MNPAQAPGKKKTGKACAVLACLPVGFILILIALGVMGGILIIADPLRPTDAIAILSGGGDLARLEEAARLNNEHYARWFILTETGMPILPGSDAHYSNVLKQEAILLGVQDENILFTKGTVSSTRDEAKAIKDILLGRQCSSVIVVTDPYHTFRTRLIFMREFQGSGIKLVVRPVQGHWYHSYDWFFSRRGWQATLSEYIKLIGVFFDLSS